MNTAELYDWLRWRLEDVALQRREDYRAGTSGGAGYDEGVLAGEERALRDVIDMVESLQHEGRSDG